MTQRYDILKEQPSFVGPMEASRRALKDTTADGVRTLSYE
jgi:hypothetical protein